MLPIHEDVGHLPHLPKVDGQAVDLLFLPEGEGVRVGGGAGEVLDGGFVGLRKGSKFGI